MLNGRAGTSLACGACGAPLKNLKMLRCDRQGVAAERRKPTKSKGRGAYGAVSNGHSKAAFKEPKKSKRKKRKSLFKDWLEDAFDVIEDIFD